MGVLDDAIREHLDLKRRHGAAEEDLRRQEEEALGPTRREVAPAEADEDGAGAEAPVEADAEAVEPVAEAPAVAEPEPAEPDLAEQEEPELAEHEELELVEHDEPELSESLPAHTAPSEAHDDGVALHEAKPGDTPQHGFEELDDDGLLDEEEAPLEEEPLPHDDEEPLPHEELAGDGETAEGDDADLLEDTPDFLEDTPEHDRLWFEQKPPRDFDFD
jgi:hypothetical protein